MTKWSVTGELGEDAERLEFTKSGDVTRIKVVLPNRSHHADDTDLIVKMPGGAGLSVNVVSADISVKGVRGAQRLQSVSGDVRTEAAGEDVECRTVSGDVVRDRIRQERPDYDHDREWRRVGEPRGGRAECQYRERQRDAWGR